jgi:hypothetical protein
VNDLHLRDAMRPEVIKKTQDAVRTSCKDGDR